MSELFDSLNIYKNAVVVTAQTVQELLDMIKAFRTPIEVTHIISHAGRVHAIVRGDIRVVNKKQSRKAKKELSNG